MELKAGSIRIKHHYLATFVTSWEINACQVALPLCTNEGGFYEGYLKAPCLWLSTAAPFHCSHIHDDTQQTQRPVDRRQSLLYTCVWCMKRDMSPETGWIFWTSAMQRSSIKTRQTAFCAICRVVWERGDLWLAPSAFAYKRLLWKTISANKGVKKKMKT